MKDGQKSRSFSFSWNWSPPRTVLYPSVIPLAEENVFFLVADASLSNENFFF